MPQPGETPLDVTPDNGVGFSTKLLNRLRSLHMHTSAAESRSQKLFFECGRLVARIFDSQLRLNFGVSVFVLLVAAVPLIFNSAACLAFARRLDGRSSG